MTVLLLTAVALAVVGAAAVLIARDRPLLDTDPELASALRWPPAGPLDADDLAQARFSVVVRGYRMDEVDRVLGDARTALAARDALIAELRAQLSETSPRAGAVQGVEQAEPEDGADAEGAAGRVGSGPFGDPGPAAPPEDPVR